MQSVRRSNDEHRWIKGEEMVDGWRGWCDFRNGGGFVEWGGAVVAWSRKSVAVFVSSRYNHSGLAKHKERAGVVDSWGGRMHSRCDAFICICVLYIHPRSPRPGDKLFYF